MSDKSFSFFSISSLRLWSYMNNGGAHAYIPKNGGGVVRDRLASFHIGSFAAAILPTAPDIGT
jgi:hypothetical protein